MSRHGYVDEVDDPLALGRYRAQVMSAIRGRRGQAFLRELAEALDAMPVQELFEGQLVDDQGGVCAIGAVCVARGLETKGVDVTDAKAVGDLVGIARQLAAEIEFVNDDGTLGGGHATPAERWRDVRSWVAEHLEPRDR